MSLHRISIVIKQKKLKYVWAQYLEMKKNLETENRNFLSRPNENYC